MKKEISTDLSYKEALEVLRECSTKNGLFASGGRNGYRGVWSRDSMISLIGASVNGSDFIKHQFKKSLTTLKKNQSKLGQIPNAVYNFENKKPTVDYLSIDSSLWFVIGEYFYKNFYKDNSMFKNHEKSVQKAVTWLKYQNVGEDVMLEQLPTTDWQDAFPHKYGRAISTQALYYGVLKLIGEDKEAKKLKYFVNAKEGYRLWNGNFYYAYRWKNHRKYKEIGEWFDSLGNLMTIVFGLAEKKHANKIISYIKKNKINHPYPVKAIFPPINKRSKYWKDYYLDCDAGKPYHYLNAGVWGFIGGFYILSLIKLKRFNEARKELEKLAEANSKRNIFPEWINPLTKETHGKLQAWSAGMYIAAYESLKKKKVLI